MIFDRIEFHNRYPFGRLWEAAFKFLKTVTAETECGKYVLEGEELFATIDSYRTKTRDTAKLETHRKYVDIQFLISGEETHEFFSKNELLVSEPYHQEKDAEFYRIPNISRSHIVLRPGDFAVYFPQDAHMPCLATGSLSLTVKKAVAKIAADRLG
ncbi:MAG: hypothetical protein PWQ29_30 [Verrucomicrobiota bacterium]|jgi:YhcH/YjgK/YiaL family protein|nr:hypothetical protein [Verrucomicrobiota bacterium]MDK2962636.1 hypothetical protein [Verrucomicrobiota bacterium]